LAVIQKNGLQLEYVPENQRTLEICQAAIKQDNGALKFVPEVHRLRLLVKESKNLEKS
jgi:hypothetical protein